MTPQSYIILQYNSYFWNAITTIMNFLKILASYIYPITIKSIPSERSGVIELTLVNGRLVMDSKNANYSYGSLQKVLKKGLQFIGSSRLHTFNSILVLGVAGGSVIKTLREDFKLSASITGVEIDGEILDLANTYFQLNKIEKLHLIKADAFTYIKSCQKKFDLIIVDIFNDSQMSTQLFDLLFWEDTHKTLNNNGVCLFNTIIHSKENQARNLELTKQLEGLFTKTETLKTHQINELFLLSK